MFVERVMNSFKDGDKFLEQVNLFLAFGAGFLSFISPCALPLYPAFLSYITGMTINELREGQVILKRRLLYIQIYF